MPHTPAAAARTAHWTGVACGMGAGALWGLVFLAPELVRDFGPVQMSIGRYALYGLIALALLLPRWPALRCQVTRTHWVQLGWLSLVGNTLYYVLLAAAVQTSGIALTSLVIGFLPVAVTIIGSRDQGAVPLRRLLPSLALAAAGAVCIGWQAIAGPSTSTPGQRLLGLLCAVGALVSWTTYAVANARVLRRPGSIASHDWSLLTGIVTGAQSLLLLPLALLLEDTQHAAADWLRFLGVCAMLAVLASIVGNALWNRMSRLLPLTLVGQMILFETLFALLYGFAWEQRLPVLSELLALACVVGSVTTCLAAHRRPAPASAGAQPGTA